MNISTHQTIVATSWCPLSEIAGREIYSITAGSAVYLLSAPLPNGLRCRQSVVMREINQQERDELLRAQCGLPYGSAAEVPEAETIALKIQRAIGCSFERALSAAREVRETLLAKVRRYAATLPVGTYRVSRGGRC